MLAKNKIPGSHPNKKKLKKSEIKFLIFLSRTCAIQTTLQNSVVLNSLIIIAYKLRIFLLKSQEIPNI